MTKQSRKSARRRTGLSAYVNSFRPFRHGAPLLLAAFAGLFVSAQFNADSFSPVAPHINYLETICAPDSPHSDAAKIVFVGPSFARTNIDPFELESFLAEHGYPNVHVLLIGVLSMNLQGGNAVVDRLLEVENIDQSLSLIVVDQSYLPAMRAHDPARGTLPYLWLWGGHAFTQVPPTLRTILISNESTREKWQAVADLAWHIVKGVVFAHTGSALRRLAGRTLYSEDPNNAFSLAEPLETSQGFVALEGREGAFEQQGPESWDRAVRRYRNNRGRLFGKTSINSEIYAWPFEKVLAPGRFPRAAVISMLSPSYFTHTDPDYLENMLTRYDPARCALWDFGDPGAYPGVWDWSARHENAHLNREGARILARRLGEKIVRFYKQNPEIYNGRNE